MAQESTAINRDAHIAIIGAGPQDCPPHGSYLKTISITLQCWRSLDE